jgi:hypothetical protein
MTDDVRAGQPGEPAVKDSWLTHGVRVGQVHRYEGERLREIGLEPDPNPSPPVTHPRYRRF